ncbi:MAG: hypothetical protein IKO14_04820 [Oscillibacter sp.]|nr:hypothetical protein [Oscillibacter sp.]
MPANDTVDILGTRGSVGVGGGAYAVYGGATTCVVARFGGNAVILDAGSGLMNLPRELCDAPSLPLLLTHAHADHLLGLPLCPYAMRRGAKLDIYGKTRNGLGVEAQVKRFMSPPLWPVEPELLPAEIGFHDLPDDFDLSGIRVKVMEGVHPNGVSLFRLERGGKSLVMMTDCTLTEQFWPSAVEFAGGCSLLLCDGQYSDAEWPTRSGFGHNAWSAAAKFARECGAGQARIVHHDPFHTDAVLRDAESELDKICPGCTFAKEGEEIAL